VNNDPVGIVKKHAVKQAEPCRLGNSTSGSSAVPPTQPQARIIEQDETRAVVEMTCGCGRKLHLNCLFGADPSQDSPVEPSNTQVPTQQP